MVFLISSADIISEFDLAPKLNGIEEVHQISVTWSTDIWSFGLYFVYMVNGQSDFSTKFFGYMVISAIWSTLPGQNRGPYIRSLVYKYGMSIRMLSVDRLSDYRAIGNQLALGVV